MKRFFVSIVLLVSLISIFNSCKKTLKDDYLNPDLITQGSLGNLFTGMLLNNRIHTSYWDYYTFIMTVSGPYAQMCAINPGSQMYIPNATYTSSRWADYYDGSVNSSSPDYNYSGPGIKSNYTEMQTTYESLSASDQVDNYVYLQLGKIILCDQTAQMVDLWGNIPFFKSNSLNSTRTISDAPYDNAELVYDSLIVYLNDINSYLDTASISSVAKKSLTKQDLIYEGDITKWRKYTNSLRLRLLMRISNYNESFAKTEVSAMLNNSDSYPLLEDNEDNAQFNQSPTTLESSLSGAISLAPYAPGYLIDTLMSPNNDPRLPVYFDPNAAGKYQGFPYNGTSADYSAAVSSRSLATIDSATFIYNYNVPGILFNAAETDFLKAEAYERWGLGDASIPYYAGIDQSIAFYFTINQSRYLSTGSWPILSTPTSSDISTYKAMDAIAYSGSSSQKLAKIYTQKWEHFYILQAQQAWAEYRRTGYPALNFYVNSSSANSANPPLRLLYPSEQALYNSTNYAAVASKDTRDTKIFWDIN